MSEIAIPSFNKPFFAEPRRWKVVIDFIEIKTRHRGSVLDYSSIGCGGLIRGHLNAATIIPTTATTIPMVTTSDVSVNVGRRSASSDMAKPLLAREENVADCVFIIGVAQTVCHWHAAGHRLGHLQNGYGQV